METVVISADARQGTGKKAAKAVRKEGLIPGVLYNSKENIHLTINPKEVKDLVYTPDFKLAKVQVDGKDHTCIVQDIQFHPVTDEMLHIDFLELEEGRKVVVNIPVRFKGTSPGVKNGGKLIQKLRKLKVKTLPEEIISEVYADISTLTLGQTVRVKDIEISDNIEIMNSLSIPVGSVEVPRALRSAQAGEEGSEEEGEGEGGEEASED